jgi:hypothetical protein
VGTTDEGYWTRLSFGYRVEHRAGLLIQRQPDYSVVAAFSLMGADPFEAEAAVWEDAD